MTKYMQPATWPNGRGVTFFPVPKAEVRGGTQWYAEIVLGFPRRIVTKTFARGHLFTVVTASASPAGGR